jgi:hypothetical protein
MAKQDGTAKKVKDQGAKKPQGLKKDQAPTQSLGLENEGEGNKTAARRYNEATQQYIESGKVEPAAKEAEAALDGPEAEELELAEEEGKRPGEDHGVRNRCVEPPPGVEFPGLKKAG